MIWSRPTAPGIFWGGGGARAPLSPKAYHPWTLIQGDAVVVRWGGRGANSGIASAGIWSLIQGDQSHVLRWAARGRPATRPQTDSGFSVAGSITARFTVPPPQGFSVAGHVAFSVPRVGGAVALTGAFSCAGQVDAVFSIPAPNSFQVVGDILATFYGAAGQMESCIAGPGVPAADESPAPWNAVY